MMENNFTSRNNNTIQVFWVGMGSLSSFALAIFSAAILSRYFDKTEYGTYRQIIYVYNTLLVVFTAGLPKVFGYFLPRYSLSKGKDIVWKISRLLFIGGFLFSIFLFLFSNLLADWLNNPKLALGLKYFSPIPMLLLPTLGLEGIFSAYKKSLYIAIYNTLSRFLMLIFIVVPVIIFKGNYFYAIYGWIIASTITLVVAFYFKGIPFKEVNLQKSCLTFKEIISYSFPLVGATIADIAFRGANQFYISRFFGPEAFAEFSNGFIEIPFVQMITGATSIVLMPIFSKIIYNKSDVSQLTNLWRTAMQKSAIMIYPIVIFFLFFSKEIIVLVYSDIYSTSSKYFIVAMLTNFFNIILFAPILLAMGESKFYALVHYVLAILAWIIQYIGILMFRNPISVAIVYVILGIIQRIVFLLYISKKIDVSFITLFPILRFLKIIMHSLLSLIPMFIIGRLFMPQFLGVFKILIIGIGYLLILFSTSKIFKINYFEIASPLLNKKRMA